MAERRPAPRRTGSRPSAAVGRPSSPRRAGYAVAGPMPWWTTAMIVLDAIWLVFTLLGTAVIFALTTLVDQQIGWYLLVLLVIAAYAAFVTVPLSAVLIVVLAVQRRWPWMLVPILVLGAVVTGVLAAT